MQKLFSINNKLQTQALLSGPTLNDQHGLKGPKCTVRVDSHLHCLAHFRWTSLCITLVQTFNVSVNKYTQTNPGADETIGLRSPFWCGLGPLRDRLDAVCFRSKYRPLAIRINCRIHTGYWGAVARHCGEILGRGECGAYLILWLLFCHSGASRLWVTTRSCGLLHAFTDTVPKFRNIALRNLPRMSCSWYLHLFCSSHKNTNMPNKNPACGSPFPGHFVISESNAFFGVNNCTTK